MTPIFTSHKQSFPSKILVKTFCVDFFHKIFIIDFITQFFSSYRRAGQFLKRFQEQKQVTESQNLSMFLASHDKITEELKKRLVTISNYEDLILDIINICVTYYEQELYLVPDDKHMLLKVIGFGLNILDNPDRTDAMSIYKLDSKKRINLSKIDKMFRELQVVTLFGDMQITLSNYVEKMSDYKENQQRWTCTNIKKDTVIQAKV